MHGSDQLSVNNCAGGTVNNHAGSSTRQENCVGGNVARRTWPFEVKDVETQLGRAITDISFLEVACDDMPLYSYVHQYVSKRLVESGSSSMSSAKPSKQRARADDVEDTIIMFGKGIGKANRGSKRKRDKESRWPKDPVVGLGWHTFHWATPEPQEPEAKGGSTAAEGDNLHDPPPLPPTEEAEKKESEEFRVLLQTFGAPVKSDMGPCQFYTSIVLFVRGPGRTGILWDLCREAARVATEVQNNAVSIWRYDMKHHYWQQLARRQPRVLKSVIMEKEQKNKLCEDIYWFLKDETADFYAKHGIPYHRSYLFYGPPGSGKTSCIFALAGHFKRNVCFIQFNKGSTDDSFRLAVSDAPSESMVIMEDVDALFTVHRDTTECSSLSFSGFLNALDGLGAPEDVIFIMTTNHPDRLDPAVRRPGRVDMHVNFTAPSRDMAAEFFRVFFPDHAAEATGFAAATGERLRGGDLSMAQLQHFFLECHRRGKDAKAALEFVKSYHFEGGSSSAGSRMIV